MAGENGVTNMDDFDDWIGEQMGSIQAESLDEVEKIGADLWGRITKKTPVDKGRARASWNNMWGRPDPEVPSEGSHGPPDLPDPGTAIPGMKLHISSNLHYIPFLEEGKPGPGSPKAPEGMVKVSIEEILAAFG